MLLAQHATPMADPAWHERLKWSIGLLALLIPTLYLTEFAPWVMFDSQSLGATGQFLASFWPPQHSAEFLNLLLVSTWQTVSVATAGVTIAFAGALPLALIANRALSISQLGTGRMSRAAATVRWFVRWVLIFLRSIPELVWGLIFVRAVGLGDTAGVMAIALTFCGMMGKVFLEIFESQESRAGEALLANGAGRIPAFLYGTLPTCLPEMVSYTVFRWECAMRSSVILGFVGAGGLGQQMEFSMRMLAGDEVIVFLTAFVVLVWVADLISKRLREYLA